MTTFPQTKGGTLAQFPVQRSQLWRAIVNTLESGEQIMLPDAAGGQIAWVLTYQDLTEGEAANISTLFNASQGRFGMFAFIDPMANLLGWSEDFSKPSWQSGLMKITSGISDPLGTQRASTVANSTEGTQTLQQTLSVPGEYVMCFSGYFRADTNGTVTINRDSLSSTASVGPLWQRTFVTGSGSAGATQSSFAITVGAGETIQVFGLQVEAQPYPSPYKPTLTPAGIYRETWFGEDVLTIAHTSPGLSSCEVTLISRVPGA